MLGDAPADSLLHQAGDDMLVANLLTEAESRVRQTQNLVSVFEVSKYNAGNAPFMLPLILSACAEFESQHPRRSNPAGIRAGP